MQLKEMMTAEPEIVSPADSLEEAARKMKELDVGMMPVCDGKRVVGILTDRDVTVRATAEGRDAHTTSVEEAMTRDPVYAFDDQDEKEAAEMMERNQIRRLVVVDRDKNLAGVVSLGDVAVKGGDEKLAGEATQQVSQPSRPNR